MRWIHSISEVPLSTLPGPAALLVAKTIKLGERLDKPHRLLPKDAGDIFRLYDAYDVDEMSARLAHVSTGERSAEVSALAAGYLRTLFATPRSPGIALAVDALGQAMSGGVVTRTVVSYTRSLLDWTPPGLTVSAVRTLRWCRNWRRGRVRVAPTHGWPGAE